MGFSVSTTFALIFFGTLVAISGIFAATSNSIEEVQGALEDRGQDHRAVQETAINVTSVDLNSCTVQITATNDGSTELGLNDTDVLVDGRYYDGWQEDASVDGDKNTSRWHPEDELTLNVTVPETPTWAKVVTGSGVAATARYTGVQTC